STARGDPVSSSNEYQTAVLRTVSITMWFGISTSASPSFGRSHWPALKQSALWWTGDGSLAWWFLWGFQSLWLPASLYGRRKPDRIRREQTQPSSRPAPCHAPP